MEFRIDDSKINKLKSLLRKEKKSLFILWLIEKIALIAGTAVFAGYVIYNYSNNMYRSSASKSNTFYVFLCCILVWGVFRFALTLAQNYTVNRVSNEVVKIDRNILYYCFEPRDISGFNNLINIIAVDMNTISDVSFNEKNRKLTIEGKMLGVKVDMIDKLKITSEKMSEKKIELIDYFSPSLYAMLLRYEELHKVS